MYDETMVERVAQALFDVELGNGAWDDLLSNAKVHQLTRPTGTEARYLSRARAAIEAMREPTPAMIAAWSQPSNLEEYTDKNCARADWQAMIDAALLD